MLLDGHAERCTKKKTYRQPEPTLGLAGEVDMWVPEDQKRFSLSVQQREQKHHLPVLVQSHTESQQGKQRVWPEHKALLKGLELPQGKLGGLEGGNGRLHTSSPDSQVSSALYSGRLCVTPATPRASVSCQASSEQYSLPLSCGFRRHI